MFRMLAFVLALLLLAGSVDPTRGWMVTLTVLTGLGALRRPWWRFGPPRLALDLRLAAFALAVVLLTGAVEPARDWFVVLSVVTGLAAFMPRLLAFDAGEWRASRRERAWARRERRWQGWVEDWEGDGWR